MGYNPICGKVKGVQPHIYVLSIKASTIQVYNCGNPRTRQCGGRLSFQVVRHLSRTCIYVVLYIYSRTSMARTRRDRRCEFDPSMCSSETLPDNFQVGSCVLNVITDTTFFINQSCKAHVTHVTDQ